MRACLRQIHALFTDATVDLWNIQAREQLYFSRNVFRPDGPTDSMKSRYLPILLALMVPTLLSADSITVLQLQSRPAAEVIPIIEPFLGPGDRISGQGFRILLRASPQTVAEVRELIEGIDVAAKTLMISVFQGRENELNELEFSGIIRIENGDISGRVSAGETRRSDSGGPVHRLRINEGSQGFIATGTRSGLFSTAGVNVGRGFYVLPRINGDRVMLEISPFRNSLNRSSGVIEVLQASTTISGRLGEWLPLGGVDESSDRGRGDSVDRRSKQQEQRDSIWIRADLAR